MKIALAATVAAAVAGAVAVPAYAATTTKAKALPGVGFTLNVREYPRLNAPVKSTLRHGQTFTVSCYVIGDRVTGPQGTHSVWYRVGNTHDYVSKAWSKVTSGPQRKCADPKPAPAPKPAYPYSGKLHLPFAKGTGFAVTQSPGGSYSHYDQWNRHAIDFATPTGTPLYATGPGKVRHAGWGDPRYGNGIELLIDHGNNRCTQMLHMNGVDVKVGQMVAMGQRVGSSGTSGYNYHGAFAPHLHLNVVRCSDRVSLETPNTFEAGRNFPVKSRPVSTNPTR